MHDRVVEMLVDRFREEVEVGGTERRRSDRCSARFSCLHNAEVLHPLTPAIVLEVWSGRLYRINGPFAGHSHWVTPRFPNSPSSASPGESAQRFSFTLNRRFMLRSRSASTFMT
jgi:hypothetical protein